MQCNDLPVEKIIVVSNSATTDMGKQEVRMKTMKTEVSSQDWLEYVAQRSTVILD